MTLRAVPVMPDEFTASECATIARILTRAAAREDDFASADTLIHLALVFRARQRQLTGGDHASDLRGDGVGVLAGDRAGGVPLDGV